MSRILFDGFDAPAAPIVVPPAPGVDKIISFDPPGAIGLVDRDAIVHLRLDETTTDEFPRDAAGNLLDLNPLDGDADAAPFLVMPVVVDASLGRGRLFDPNTNWTGIGARDRVSGSTLLTRDMSIQVVLSWNATDQQIFGDSGSIISRGVQRTPPTVAEYLAYGLQIDVIDAPLSRGTLRWLWQDVAGALKLQAGADFVNPSGTFTLLTATRRWVSPTEVLLRYYIGDLMIGEVASADGSIGGGTTGTTQVGTRGVGGSNFRFFAGIIDEIMVLDRELTREEIEATWLRITQYQPLGYQLMRETHDPGFPLPADPGSDVQMDLRMIGNALGYAAAQAENVRANILPQRAYGSVLEDWETTVRVTPEPLQDVDTRRARELAKIRQRRGSTLPGFGDALEGLLGGGALTDLQFLAFSNEIDTDFTTIDPLRWDETPLTAFSVVSGAASCQPGAGTFTMDGATRNWVTMRQTVGGDGRQAHQLCKLVFTTPQSVGESGIYFENATTNTYLLLGLRDDAGSFKIQTESFIAGVSQGLVTQATLGANPAAVWLHLYQTTTDGTWTAAWSVTSATAGFTLSSPITHPTVAHWGGLYLRSVGASGAPRADFDDHRLYEPFSGRANNAYILLDRALGFSPDIDGANSVVSAVKHAFAHGAFITNPVLLADDPDGGAGVAPTGGY